jgi:tetratricopeptide (TPR) repeat protein
MNEELRINSEESDAIDSYHKFNERGFDCFYRKEYDSAIKNLERALDALELYIPTNIKFILVNLSHRLLFLGLRNEIILQLGISYRKSGFYYKAKEIFEGLIHFTEEFRVGNFLGFKEMILGYYPISRNDLLSTLWSEIGLTYKDLKLYNKALNAFYKSTHTFSIKTNPWLEIAYLHEQLGAFKEAKSAKKKFKKTNKLIKKADRKKRCQW